jgi:hypothetical protein
MRADADNAAGMSGTRALFASIGASVLLVGAAALSLLAVSAVFAFGGWSDPVAASSRQAPLVLASSAAADRQASRKTLVLPARAAADRRPPASRGSSAPQGTARAAGNAAITPVTNRPAQAAYNPPPVDTSTEGEAVTPKAPAAPKNPGDGVRSAGEGLSGTVQSTGDALAQLTDPLLPPVTAATQKVLDVVAELLRRATGGLGNTVDRLLPAQ